MRDQTKVPSGRTTATPPPTIGELLDEYAEFSRRYRHLSPDTISSQRVYLSRAIRDLGGGRPDKFLKALTPRRIMRFAAAYAAGNGSGARGWMRWSLRSLLKFCHLRGYAASDLRAWLPAARRPRLASVPKAMPEDAIARLLDSIGRGEPDGKRDIAIIQLLATYGARGHQIRNLRLSDLDWAGSRIHFAACKNGRPVVQHLTPEAGNRLLDYIRDGRPRGASHQEVFLTARPPHRPLKRPSEMSALIARRLRRAGIRLPEGVSRGAHGFRHAFATRLCGKLPLKHISDMLGHRCPSTTLVYAKVDFDGLAHAALPWPEEDAR
jgi:integrase